MIVTQALCAVCAVSVDDVRAVAARLPGRPAVLSLDPESLDQVLGDLVELAAAAGRRGDGLRLRAGLRERVAAVRDAVAGSPRPRVAALEWLDPLYVGGHWVPEMIELAGGRDVLGEAGRRSRTIGWADLEAAVPEVIVVMPCGLYAEEAAAQARAHEQRLRALGARVIAVDAASSFSRPGPRLVEGIELLGALLHPGSVEAAPGIAHREPFAPASA